MPPTDGETQSPARRQTGCRATLAAKLGITPAPETEALHRALQVR